MDVRPGALALDAHTVITADPAFSGEANFLAEHLRAGTGLPVEVRPTAPAGAAVIRLTAQGAADQGNEGYSLESNDKGVLIQARTTTGIFYGCETLLQLLPPQVFGKANATASSGIHWTLPFVKIEDRPRFAWRGFMLDFSRHFFDVEYTKHLLDAMAMNKLNVLHMHLADDDGWRIEIRKYPKLTEIGAWRGTKCAVPNTRPGETFERYGGFFTQDQIRELVAYAERLHINLMPELDFPGHSLAMCTVYPETKPNVSSGATSVQGHSDDALSPAKEANYKMLDDIFAELASLFPFEYVHIGGDEVNHNLWKDDPEIKEFMAREKIGNLHDAQVYFTKRMEVILASHNKKMIGWNEITSPKLERTTGIMAWTGAGAGYNAARMGFPVVMAPGQRCYFDMPFPDAHDEPPSLGWAGPVSTESCYDFDPMGEDKQLDADQTKRIFGVQACLWSELVKPWTSKEGWADFKTGGETADYKIFPRLCALAEMGWTPQADRHYADFAERLGQTHLLRLKYAGVGFRLPPPEATVRKGAIQIVPPYQGAEIKYTVDGTDPFSSKTAVRWDGKPIAGNASLFRARTFLLGQPSPLRSGAKIEAAGKWTKDMAGADFKPQDFDATGIIDEAGRWRLTFRKTGGKHAVLVNSVELLVNGASVAKDAHPGGSASKGVYHLDVKNPIPAGAKVVARVEMKGDNGSEKPDSAGEILVEKSMYLEPAATATTSIGAYQSNTPDKLVDYDSGTYFWSDRSVRKGETVTIAFTEPVALSSIEWASGKPDDTTKDMLVNGVLEVSADGTNFNKAADFSYGTAHATLTKAPLKAIRVTVTGNSDPNWLILQDPKLK